MIFTSTSCLRNPKKIISVLDEYHNNGIKHVELGSIHSYFDIKLLKNYDFDFIIHNYFPPPKTPFNFNLASQNKLIRKKSIQLAKSAIDLCCKLNSNLYSFHAGFTVDPKTLGKAFSRNLITSKAKALTTFIESVEYLVDYSKSNGISLAIEPNVVQKFNLVKGKNELLLLADYDEIELFYKYFKKSQVGLLLDLGHTAVTSTWLKFDKDEFVNKCADKVLAIHVSNNDGYKDQHKSLTKSCWQISKLKKFKHLPISLETMNLTIDQLKKNIQLAKNAT